MITELSKEALVGVGQAAGVSEETLSRWQLGFDVSAKSVWSSNTAPEELLKLAIYLGLRDESFKCAVSLLGSVILYEGYKGFTKQQYKYMDKTFKTLCLEAKGDEDFTNHVRWFFERANHPRGFTDGHDKILRESTCRSWSGEAVAYRFVLLALSWYPLYGDATGIPAAVQRAINVWEYLYPQRIADEGKARASDFIIKRITLRNISQAYYDILNKG